MNQETTPDFDAIEAYIREAQRDLTFAKGQEPGTSYEAVNLDNARMALENALAVLARALPPR
jgi:hypothetical protein